MASSRKPRSGEAADALARAVAHSLEAGGLAGKRLVAALSGGVDSVVLLHVLHRLRAAHRLRLSAVHVNHGLSPNAADWARFCRRYCRSLGVPLAVRQVKVRRAGAGVEAAAREARYEVLKGLRADAVVLAHHLDDQAETVLLNLLRGTGPAGARGMPRAAPLGAMQLLRPFLDIPREAILAYARESGLAWIEDESNADEAFTRNFLRHRVGPLLDERFPRWRENVARAARLFAAEELQAHRALRGFLQARGLRAPSEAKLQELLRQLVGEGKRVAVRHDGHVVRMYRGAVRVEPDASAAAFAPVAWAGERRLRLPPGWGEVRFRRASAPGEGLDPARVGRGAWRVQRRRGGERLKPDARRPSRSLKNLFQEAGIAPWQRDAMPLLYCGEDLVWVPGIGIDCRYVAAERRGFVPEWRRERL